MKAPPTCCSQHSPSSQGPQPIITHHPLTSPNPNIPTPKDALVKWGVTDIHRRGRGPRVRRRLGVGFAGRECARECAGLSG